jgi:16S rRNA (cytosine967-C5)-methyltransferase
VSALRARFLRAGANATAPGGALVYSVCTISRAEGIGVVEAFVRERTDFELEDLGPMLPAAALGQFLQTLPSRDRTDGFFIARLRRKVADTGRVSL